MGVIVAYCVRANLMVNSVYVIIVSPAAAVVIVVTAVTAVAVVSAIVSINSSLVVPGFTAFIIESDLNFPISLLVSVSADVTFRHTPIVPFAFIPIDESISLASLSVIPANSIGAAAVFLLLFLIVFLLICFDVAIQPVAAVSIISAVPSIFMTPSAPLAVDYFTLIDSTQEHYE